MNTNDKTCILSSLIFDDNSMNETLGSFALFRDETKSWDNIRKVLEDNNFIVSDIDGNGVDFEIRKDEPLTKEELYASIKNILIDYSEKNNLAATEDIYKVGIGNQLIFTLQKNI